MEDLSHDFDVLAERADDFGALWAVRVLYRLVSTGQALPSHWPGTKAEARSLVATFADRVGFADGEKLAVILQYAAELMWAESLELIRTAPMPLPTVEHRPLSSSIASYIEKLSPS